MAEELAGSPVPALITELAPEAGPEVEATIPENDGEKEVTKSRPATRMSTAMPSQDGVKATFSRPATAFAAEALGPAEDEAEVEHVQGVGTQAVEVPPVADTDGSTELVQDPSQSAQPEPEQQLTPATAVEPTTLDGSTVEEQRYTADIYNDAEWDTDLDDEEEDVDESSAKTRYLNSCKKHGIVPASCFLRHMEDKEIEVKNHGLSLIETKLIAKALKSIITVEKVNLEGNRMAEEGSSYICRMLEENEYIQEMNLSYNCLGNAGTTCVTRMLATNVTLRKMYLTGNDMDDKIAEQLAEALEEAKSLRELYLNKNNLGEHAGEVLGPAIGANDTLEVLDLSWNKIRRKGAVAVAKGIKDNIRLKICNLSWNGFGEEGGLAIADALSGNSSLLVLDVSSNRLNLNVAVKLSKTLASNETLQTLKIGNNPMSTAGCVTLLAALSSGSSQISCLDLTENPVEYEFIKAKEELAKQKPLIHILHGPILRAGNTSQDIGKPGVDVLRKSRKSMRFLQEQLSAADTERLAKLLSARDIGGKHEIMPDELIKVIQETDPGIDINKVREAVRGMEKTKDSKVNYGELLSGVVH